MSENTPSESPIQIEILGLEDHQKRVEETVSKINAYLLILEKLLPQFVQIDINVTPKEQKDQSLWMIDNQIICRVVPTDEIAKTEGAE